MKFLSVIVALLCANFAFADSELTQQEKAFGCVKPKTEQKFDYVECINQKNFAIVGNIVQTPHGDFPYPLGLVDNNGKLILPNEYHAITYPREWGYDYTTSSETLPDGLIIVVKRDLNENPMFGNLGVTEQHGLVNPKGEFVVPLGEYDEIFEFYDNGLISVLKNDKYGFINTKGEIAIPLMYDDTNGGFHQGLASVEKNGKFGMIDVKNQTVIPFDYDNLKILENLDGNIYFEATKNDKSALLNPQNQTITKYEYDFISPIYRSEFFIVKQGKKHGVIDNTGKIIVPIEYDFIDDTLQSTDPYNFDLSQDYIRASQDDKDYLFDKMGKQVKQK
nr:WG repeat-containing protein [uncultured Moraxella sp.]